MQFLALVALSFVVQVSAVVPAPGQQLAVFSFNNGLDEVGKSCPPNEWKSVLGVLADTSSNHGGRRRQLVSKGSSSSSDHVNTAQLRGPPPLKGVARKLSGTCIKCGSYCGSTGAPYCPAGGKGSRRRQLETEQQRQLSAATAPCQADVDAATAALNTLAPTLSPTCQALLAAPRNITCHAATACGIDHVNVWNVTSNTLQIEDFSLVNGTLCTSHNVTFTAETNYEPKNVKFNLTSSTNGYKLVNTEYGAPFFLHPRKNGVATGVKFQAGNYTLRIRGDDGTQSKTVHFVVHQC